MKNSLALISLSAVFLVACGGAKDPVTSEKVRTDFSKACVADANGTPDPKPGCDCRADVVIAYFDERDIKFDDDFDMASFASNEEFGRVIAEGFAACEAKY